MNREKKIIYKRKILEEMQKNLFRRKEQKNNFKKVGEVRKSK